MFFLITKMKGDAIDESSGGAKVENGYDDEYIKAGMEIQKYMAETEYNYNHNFNADVIFEDPVTHAKVYCGGSF